MASHNKKQKTDKKKHPGRGGSFLKGGIKKGKGFCFYNSADRADIKRKTKKEL